MATNAPRPALRAGAVVGLSLATSAVAHLDASGLHPRQLLPGAPGRVLLLGTMTALWLVCALADRAGRGRRWREASLLSCFATGQLLGHLAWSLGGASASTATLVTMAHGGMPGAPSSMTAGITSPGPQVLDHAAMGHAEMGHEAMAAGMSMQGMATGTPPAADHAHTMGLAMLLTHVTAALVSHLLLLAAEHLVAHARDWLARLTPQPPHPVHPTPIFRAALGVVLRRSTWALPRPPPRRGPPRLV